MTGSLVEMFLMTMCTNYPVLNVTTPEPPPWQWVPERKTPRSDGFYCMLKQIPQLKRELLRGKKLRVVTIDHWPVSWIKNVNGTMIGQGIAFEILNTLMDKFGFTYEIRLPSTMSLLDEKGTITDMLKTRQADMVAAFVPNLPDLEHVLEWGVELCQYEYVVLTKRPRESATGSGLLAPFAKEVWILILVALICTGPVIFIIMKIRGWLCRPSQVYSLTACVWFVYGALMKQGSTLSPIHDSTRVLFATWWIFIMILTAFYTANLTAFLTLSKFTLSIHTVNDIARSSSPWMAEKGAAFEYSIQMDDDLRVLKNSLERGYGSYVNLTEVDQDHIAELVMNGALFIQDRYWLNFFMLNVEKQVIDDDMHCQYVLTTEKYLTSSLSFVYPKNSILPRIFNPVMLAYVESGIIKHLLTKDLPDATICPLDLGSKERQLRNSDLATTYYVILGGFTSACLVFLCEVIVRRYHPEEDAILWPNNDKVGIIDAKPKMNPFSHFMNLKVQPERLPGMQTTINGRDYVVYSSRDGQKKLIPMRTPSALLFYSKWQQ